MPKNNCVIKIIPEKSFIDEKVDIKISGLPKNEKVLIRAVSKDYYCINAGMTEQGRNSIWEAYGIFITDNNGNIDLKNTAPIEGTYKTCNPMGLFYSMRIKRLNKCTPPQKLHEVSENRNYNVLFTVEVNNEVLTSQKHTRVFCDETIKSETIINKNLVARYFTSNKIEKRPAIIVVSGSDGRIEKAQAISEIFAAKGYSALAVCYFGMEGTSPCLNKIPLEIIKNAIDWLSMQDTVDKNRIAIYGRSKGGELVLLAASLFKELNCVIANVPSCYIYEGLKNALPSHQSSWTYQNKELPFLKFSMFLLIKMAIKKLLGQENIMSWMYKNLIKKGNTTTAAIALEKINGPILMLSSASDNIWPSLLHCEIASKRLTEKNFKYNYKHCTYEKSGHMLTLPFQSISSLNKCNNNLEAWAKACIDSWEETIEFLNNWTR
ncbi:acyl-CoA thioesterase/bile acid-CoA:amino acid N-acyltransferase family protein [Clostridium hydrogenum]|uniref:acyl-CoA thioesterase/bile acid-CoA:amino acid N-acyltransferase family protein n=1 Tax=Clostridium hydrogenum TaxID=2855764 RepID=UPI001F4535BF|nr:acyl-CoA thioesterase/bile acid-CoA:amino acid N-acyltransferase family protein [Clostridium hydrogenum]